MRIRSALLMRYAFEERVEQLWSLLGEVLAKVEAAHGPGARVSVAAVFCALALRGGETQTAGCSLSGLAHPARPHPATNLGRVQMVACGCRSASL